VAEDAKVQRAIDVNAHKMVRSGIQREGHRIYFEHSGNFVESLATEVQFWLARSVSWHRPYRIVIGRFKIGT
jgi:hypothetical protein